MTAEAGRVCSCDYESGLCSCDCIVITVVCAHVTEYAIACARATAHAVACARVIAQTGVCRRLLKRSYVLMRSCVR